MDHTSWVAGSTTHWYWVSKCFPCQAEAAFCQVPHYVETAYAETHVWVRALHKKSWPWWMANKLQWARWNKEVQISNMHKLIATWERTNDAYQEGRKTTTDNKRFDVQRRGFRISNRPKMFNIQKGFSIFSWHHFGDNRNNQWLQDLKYGDTWKLHEKEAKIRFLGWGCFEDHFPPSQRKRDVCWAKWDALFLLDRRDTWTRSIDLRQQSALPSFNITCVVFYYNHFELILPHLGGESCESSWILRASRSTLQIQASLANQARHPSSFQGESLGRVRKSTNPVESYPTNIVTLILLACHILHVHLHRIWQTVQSYLTLTFDFLHRYVHPSLFVPSIGLFCEAGSDTLKRKLRVELLVGCLKSFQRIIFDLLDVPSLVRNFCKAF